MEKKTKLKNGTEVVIRSLREDDMERLWAFFRELPDDDRKYLRVDVTKREVVENGVKSVASGKVTRLVATMGESIVADGALEPNPPGWIEHVAELRLVVARSFQRLGLGMIMARELYLIGAGQKVEKITARFLRPQEGAKKILQKLGFRQEYLMPDFAKDLTGRQQDMIIMTCEMEKMFKHLEQFYHDSDWQGSVLSGL